MFYDVHDSRWVFVRIGKGCERRHWYPWVLDGLEGIAICTLFELCAFNYGFVMDLISTAHAWNGWRYWMFCNGSAWAALIDLSYCGYRHGRQP